MADALCACPSCGAALRFGVEAASPPRGDLERWVGLRVAAEQVSQPVSRLRRLVREGALPAKVGARGARLVRVVDVDALLAELPDLEVAATGADDETDEIARLRVVGGGR